MQGNTSKLSEFLTGKNFFTKIISFAGKKQTFLLFAFLEYVALVNGSAIKGENWLPRRKAKMIIEEMLLLQVIRLD